ncbi:MAG: NAD-dependent protein deacylase [Gemmatimonadota bacterium]|nr:NAD-dependent protein deacylase [Gemmatimonadota bacterium]
MSEPLVARARSLLSAAHRVTVLTGAGISAESGIPTFRGEAGLWRSHRPEELATPEAFRRDPELVWSWYAWRRSIVAACEPNDGHLALARFALEHEAVTLVTQNVDGLHHRAAVAEADGRAPEPAYPWELHGSLLRDRCFDCNRQSDAVLHSYDAEDAGSPSGPNETDRSSVTIPRCDSCGGLLRPDVVWFGEVLPTAALESAFEAAAASDVCLVVGTSALVHPAASIPRATLRAGRPVIEVNLEPTALSPFAEVSLMGEAGATLPDLLR